MGQRFVVPRVARHPEPPRQEPAGSCLFHVFRQAGGPGSSRLICTAPDLHLGHAVNLWMMRYLQDLGHRVVFLLGDLTTRIGDPTGRTETRPVLTPAQINANAASF